MNYDCLIYTPIIQTPPICDSSSSTLTCTNGLIQIISANYGRTSTSSLICVTSSVTSAYTTQLCFNNQTTTIGNLCNGQSTCTITPSPTFFLIDPCVLTDKYLSIQYQCKAGTVSVGTSFTTTTTAQISGIVFRAYNLIFTFVICCSHSFLNIFFRLKKIK